MRLVDFLFSKPPDPEAVYHHDVLGAMNFSEDDEAWLGILNGIPVSVAYTEQSEPDPILIEYGISLAQDIAWLKAEIESQANRYISEHPSYDDEVRGLAITVIRVDRRKGTNTALIDLAGGRDFRAWRVEFSERTCEGMGFDS